MIKKAESLIGQKIGHLNVLNISHTDDNYNTYLNCQCDCGYIKPIFYGSLKNQKTKSCGRTSDCEYAFKIARDSKLGRNMIDLTGQRFGNLVVLECAGKASYGTHIYSCQCDCGTIIDIYASNLRNGVSQSCGQPGICEYAFKRISECQLTHNLSGTPEFVLWQGIKQRCYNENDPNYKNYGARGIKLYEPWINDFQAFYDYLQTLPETRIQFEARTGEISTLDRIDVNGNYEPGNLRWLSREEQSQNKRNNVLNEQLVKFILWEVHFHNADFAAIYNKLVKTMNYKGGHSQIHNIINGKAWKNINIDSEITEYRRLGTVNGVKV